MVAKEPTLFKQYVVYHKRAWTIAFVGCCSIGFLLLIIWAVSLTVDAYRPKENGLPVVSSAPRVNRKDQRKINGPLRLELEVGALRHGDQAIVKRDIVYVLSKRLEDSGVELSSHAPHALLVSYEELPGKRIRLYSEFNTKKQKVNRQFTSTTIHVTAVLKRSGTLAAHLGQQQFHGTPSELDDSRFISQSTSRLKKTFYQKDYSEFLNYLEVLPLPINAD